ncbi:uncharacterized protein CDV56_102171 [Aspergillus thermomutatus]|uniref:Uncharacterized protein n=1 Tax=Aspergillus thermomutatus TaxID=41047 RepID=A0A397HL68_ASPTH|nr:uncharacterized protein CDV56_102171 [Aspergillus thermomutatus]RHZ61983.1 hypothetical protein CDV56_102171 [Aspergillus thermomutatus]
MKGPNGQPATISEIMAEVGNLLAAGVDTTSVTIKAVLSPLLEDPSRYPRLKREIDAAREACGISRELTYHNIKDLPFLSACTMEVLSIRNSIKHDGQPKHSPVPSAFNPENFGPALSASSGLFALRTFLDQYSNPFTDSLDYCVGTVANTTTFPWRDKLLTLKEDGPLYAMDPRLLEPMVPMTLTANGRARLSPRIPSMMLLPESCSALATRGRVLDQHGVTTEKVWFTAPVCGFQHEMAATENRVLFPIYPMHLDSIYHLKAGENHWQWYPDRPYYIGVLPRRGATSSDVKWFYGANAYNGHVANAWEGDGKIHLYMSHANGNFFGFFPDKDGNSPPMGSNPARLAHWMIDPETDNLELEPEIVIEKDNEMIRVDD